MVAGTLHFRGWIATFLSSAAFRCSWERWRIPSHSTRWNAIPWSYCLHRHGSARPLIVEDPHNQRRDTDITFQNWDAVSEKPYSNFQQNPKQLKISLEHYGAGVA
jgi:hypothetical protein